MTLNPGFCTISMELFRNGDPQTFEVIFKKYYGPLCFFVTGLVSNPENSKNIVMDVFIKLWNKRIDFYEEQSIKAFLYITAKNAAFNHQRHEKVKRENAWNIWHNTETISEETTLHKMIHAELISKIYEKIEALPAQRKLVFKLAYIDELKNEEIAEMLNLSICTIKEHKGKALSTLRFIFTGKTTKRKENNKKI